MPGIAARTDAPPPVRVGADSREGTLLPTYQTVRPAGDTVSFRGRPVDLKLAPDGGWLYVKDNRGVVVLDTRQWKVVQEATLEGGTSMHGIAVTPDGGHLYVTDAQSELAEAEIAPGKGLFWKRR